MRKMKYSNDRLTLELNLSTGEATAFARGIQDPIQESLLNGIAFGVIHVMTRTKSSIERIKLIADIDLSPLDTAKMYSKTVPSNQLGLHMLSSTIQEAWDKLDGIQKS